MKIAVVHSYYSTRQPSGENTVVDDQVQALRSAGHDVRLIAKRTDDLEQGLFYGARSAVRVASGASAFPQGELARFDPDVVHVHNTFPNIGTSWLKDWRHRTVVTLHNYRTVCAAGTLFRDGAPCHECLDTPVMPALKHACYRGSRVATAPVAIATGRRGALRRMGELPAEVIVLNEQARTTLGQIFTRDTHVIPNFTSTPNAEERSGRGWAFVGRLSREKGALEMVAAWPHEEPLHIFGDGPLRPSIESLIQQRGLAVRLMGLTAHADLLQALPDYEGLVVPSMCAEGLPTAVIEALARGLPAVMSGLVSMADTVEDARAGVTLPMPATEEGMANALASVRGLPNAATAARELHRAHYSPEAWLSGVTPIYERLSAAPRR